MEQTSVKHGKVLTLPIIKRELRDLRCCDGDAVTLECKVFATPPPDIRWEKEGRLLPLGGDFSTDFDGETARLSIQHVYPEDEGEYTCVAYNDLGKAFTSACLVVDVPEEKENALSQQLSRPVGLLSAGSTPRSTPRSTPIRSLSPSVAKGREFRTPLQGSTLKRLKVTAPKFYAVPHNRVAEEGETVRFQCAVAGHPTPWVTWDKNGMVVTPSTRISIKERDDIRVLEISEVTLEDVGLYRVTLENDVGRIEATARLEIIGRHGSVTRGIRTRSASPRTYPTFGRSLLGSAARVNGRLQLQCDIRGTPSPAPTWYRNGKPLERSDRIKRYFDGRTAKIEILKVRSSDGGEYTCEATNVLGSTRNSCQVIVLDIEDPSTADKDPPRFLKELPAESIFMEGHSCEVQAKLAGTPPFSISWLKDDREIPDSDYYRYVVYGDGAVALRVADIYPQDAGEYTCLVRNEFGKASTKGLFAVQDYKGAPSMALQFTKTPVSIIASKGGTACFCARVQSGRPVEFKWTIHGKDAKDISRCKMERDGSTCILRICNLLFRDSGEVRCTASVAGGRGPMVSSTADLRIEPQGSDLSSAAFEESTFPTVPAENAFLHDERSRSSAKVTSSRSVSPSPRRNAVRLTKDSELNVKYQSHSSRSPIKSPTPNSGVSSPVPKRSSLGKNTNENSEKSGLVKRFWPGALQGKKPSPREPSTKSTVWIPRCPVPRSPIVQRRGRSEVTGTNLLTSKKPSSTSTEKRIPNSEGPMKVTLRRVRSLEKAPCLGPRFAKFRSSDRVKKSTEYTTRSSVEPASRSTMKSCLNKTEVVERILSPETTMGVPVIEVPNVIIPEIREHLSPDRSTLALERKANDVNVRNDQSLVSEKNDGEVEHCTIEVILSSANDNVQKVLQKFKSELGSRENLRKKSSVVNPEETNEEDVDSLDKNDSKTTKNELSPDDSPAIKCLRTLERSPSPPEEIKKRLAEIKRPSLERFEPAIVLKAPTDITALRGARVVLRATYKGHPDPRVRWLRAGRELTPDDRIGITSGGGVSCLTLDRITADHAGKYAVYLENALGRDCRFASVAVEGPPDPPAGTPIVSSGIGTATVTWWSPPYDGGCMVTGYSVEMRRADEQNWIVVAEACHSLSHTVSGLVPEETYKFRVRAENIHGASDPGAESSSVTILEDENQFKPAFEPREVSLEAGQLFEARYDVLEELGKGRYGVVRKVIEKSTGQNLAAKFIRTIKSKDRQQVYEEIRIMNLLRHPKLLQLAAAFESPREIVMVMEYISGGELFERVVADDFTLTERDSILFMRQICEGVEYMHRSNVVHLDLKPENIMCHTRTSHQIKLIDFGLAQMLKPDTPIRVLFGTPEFIPPEIINYEPIGTESDMWSVGVICYVLLSGLSPFMGDNDAETFANITRADYDFDDEAFNAISQDAKDFISALLEKRKELRISARQCLEHLWMAQHTESMSRVALPTDKLKKFIIRRKWQKTGNAIRALGRMATLSANSRRCSSTTESPPSTPPQSLPPLDNLDKEVSKVEEDNDSKGKIEIRIAEKCSSDTRDDFQVKIAEPKRNFEDEKLRNSESTDYQRILKDESLIRETSNSNGKKDSLKEDEELLDEEDKIRSSLNKFRDRSIFVKSPRRWHDDCHVAKSLVEPEADDEENRDEKKVTEESLNDIEIFDAYEQGSGHTSAPKTMKQQEQVGYVSIEVTLQDPALTVKNPRLSKSSEVISDNNSREYLDVNIEFCNLSKSEPEEIYLSSNNLVEVKSSVSVNSEEEVYPSSIIEPEDNHLLTKNISRSTIIEEINFNNSLIDPDLKRTRACSERSDSGISDCSITAPYSQGGELSSMIITEEDVEGHQAKEDTSKSVFGIKLRSTKTTFEVNKSSFDADEGKTSGMNRGRFIHTGSVSRAAKMFEKEDISPAKEIPTSVSRVTPSIPGKPHNERIQKVFAFWNK